MTTSLEDLKRKLTNTEEFLFQFASHLDKNFKIQGVNHAKTIKEWKKYFYINIPKELNFITVLELSSEVMKKYQEAAFCRDTQASQLIVLEQVKNEHYNKAYQDARTDHQKEFKKPLAAESCKTAAILATQELEDAMSSQKAVKDFWDRVCSSLIEMRKQLELVVRALSGDAYLQKDIIVKEKR